MPSDVQQVLARLLQEPVRFLESETTKKRLVFHAKANGHLWRALGRRGYILMAGPFTVDIQMDSSRSFVIEHSGPLLYLREPYALVDGVVWHTFKEPPTGTVLEPGFLEVQGTYYYKGGIGPTSEAKKTYKTLVKTIKTLLVRHEEEWVGSHAKALLDAGHATLRRLVDFRLPRRS